MPAWVPLDPPMQSLQYSMPPPPMVGNDVLTNESNLSSEGGGDWGGVKRPPLAHVKTSPSRDRCHTGPQVLRFITPPHLGQILGSASVTRDHQRNILSILHDLSRAQAKISIPLAHLG